MKKIVAFLLVAMMLVQLVACSSDLASTDTGTNAPTTTKAPDTNNEPVLVGTKYALNNTATWVKILDPRMEATDSLITCDWSASGIEFTATCKGDVVFEVNATTKKGGGVEGCYFRAYVDGEAYLNGTTPYYEAKGKTYITLKNLTEGTHTVRLVKATGYTLANVDLISVTVDGTVGETASAAKDTFIEFIGDDISCGYALIGEKNGAYTAQDATLAYPYLIADTLNADYSVVAISGQGILKGNPGVAGGYKYASPNRDQAAEYAFTRKPNVVVINADANDASDGFSETNYIEALESFVEYVREKNGADTHIILVGGMVKTDYVAGIKALVSKLGGAESKYYFYEATAAAGTRPTTEENVTYASELGGMIQSILDGTYSEGEAVRIPTNMIKIYEEKFDQAGEGVVATLAAGNENVFVPNTNYKRALLADYNDAEIKAFNDLLNTKFNGWKMTASMDYDFRIGGKSASKAHEIQVTNGAVTINGGGSVFQAVDPTTLANYDVYAIDMDVSIESLGMFTIFFNNNKDVGYYNGTAQGLNFRDVANGAITATSKAGNTAISMQLIDFSHEQEGMHSGNISYPKAEVNRFVDTGADYNQTFHLTILVNNTDGTVNVFIDNELVALYTNELTHKTGGGVEFMVQNSNVTIDNLVVSVVEKTA